MSGDIFGEISFIRTERASADVVATTDVSVLTLVNLSAEEQSFPLELTGAEVERATDIFEDVLYPAIPAENPTLTLSPYGYRWIRVGGVY